MIKMYVWWFLFFFFFNASNCFNRSHCNDKSFEWFQDLLHTLEDESIDGFLEIQTYLTASLNENEISNIVLNSEEGSKDAITGLRSATFFGRPNFDHILNKLRQSHSATDIGVFFCGPKVLSRKLHKSCDKWTQSTEDGTRFFYGKGQ